MIADGLLDIKIALTSEDLSGFFHDKWGVVIDENGDKIAFHGSQNDSEQSLFNYESYSVFVGWGSEREAKRVEKHERRFDEIWEGKKSEVPTLSLPDGISLEIAELREKDNRPYESPAEKKKMKSSYRWRHQGEAREEFLSEESGILKMATGTGKTRTSLKILNKLLREDEVENVVISTYGNDLLDQWYETLIDNFDPSDVLIYREYGGNKNLGSFLLKDRDELEFLIISYDNLSDCVEGSSDKLENSLLICDEVHNMGSQTRREDLSGKLEVFPYRLGLSATPLDTYDEERNEFLLDEVGPIVYEFDLDDAIRRGILCELEYTPLFYELSEEDKQRQRDQFGRFSAMKQEDPTIPKSRLYMMLARVRKESEEKLPVFRNQLNKSPDILRDCLIFVETKEYGEKVQRIIHEHTKEYRTYYGEDDEQNLKDFSEGNISTLVTSKAISEGIDIKSVKNIVLFTSNRSKGTTIQRIGRALRTDPSNPEKTANIVDFVVESDVKGEVDEDSEIEEPPDKERYEWLSELSQVSKEE
jgi:superfamily II DNA or RNA helicase